MSGHDFDELVGEDDERERLRRVHELLVAAGPPPELPPCSARPGPPSPRVRLDAPPALGARVLAAAIAPRVRRRLPRSARPGRDAGFREDFVLTMQGTAARPARVRRSQLGERDEAGNWPMRVTVRGLPKLPTATATS